MPTRNSVCRAIITATAVLFVGIGFARADEPQSLKDHLHAAEKDTSLTGDDLQPFYLKMSVQLFDAKGAPSEQGTVEIYRAGSKQEKLVYLFPSYSATEVHANGSRYRTPGVAYPPPFVTLLVRQLLHPLDDIGGLENASPQSQHVNLSKLPLNCIITAGPNWTPASLPMYPTYCLTDGDGLRVIRHGVQVVLRNSITDFQQRHVAFDVSITTNGQPTATAKVVTLEQRSLAEADFSLDGLPKVSDGVALDGPGSAGPVRVSGGVMVGMALSRPGPVYPAGARARHVEGTVVLQAQIGIDGQIHDLKVLSSPDSDLTDAAMDAVREWKYRPYMLAGKPVSVETTIQVNFTLDGH